MEGRKKQRIICIIAAAGFMAIPLFVEGVLDPGNQFHLHVCDHPRGAQYHRRFCGVRRLRNIVFFGIGAYTTPC